MLRNVDRARPTFWQRVAILMAAQVLTVLVLILWPTGSPWTETPATGAAAAPRVAAVVTVGNGYAVRRHDWQPIGASDGGAGAGVLPLAPLPPAPSR